MIADQVTGRCVHNRCQLPQTFLATARVRMVVDHDGNGRFVPYAVSVASSVRDDTTERERWFRDGRAQNAVNY